MAYYYYQKHTEEEMCDIIKKHEDNCYAGKSHASTDVFPSEDSVMKFKKYYAQLKLPFVITSDFEAVVMKEFDSDNKRVKVKKDNEEILSTEMIAKHRAISYGIQIHDEYSLYKGQKYFSYIASSNLDGVMQHFLNTVNTI